MILNKNKIINNPQFFSSNKDSMRALLPESEMLMAWAKNQLVFSITGFENFGTPEWSILTVM